LVEFHGCALSHANRCYEADSLHSYYRLTQSTQIEISHVDMKVV
jgi:hypothetical protein